MKKSLSLLAFVSMSTLISIQAIQAIEVDSDLSVYKCPSELSGKLKSAGSSTMRRLMSRWGKEFAKLCPNVRLRVGGGGSAAAPMALTEGTAHLGAMSRPMKASEIGAFKKRHGYKPTELKTSLDALSVWVHKDNPINGITLQQLDAIYSKTRHRGYRENITTWGQVGLTGDWANRSITLYELPSVSGTREFFKKEVLLTGDFKDDMNPLGGPGYMVQAAAKDQYAITYSGMGYMTTGVRAVPLARKPGDSFHQTRYEEIVSGGYPLSRFLYIYIVKDPNNPLSPLVRELAEFIFSRQGQRVVVKGGYLPLPANLVRAELEKLDNRRDR